MRFADEDSLEVTITFLFGDIYLEKPVFGEFVSKSRFQWRDAPSQDLLVQHLPAKQASGGGQIYHRILKVLQ